MAKQKRKWSEAIDIGIEAYRSPFFLLGTNPT